MKRYHPVLVALHWLLAITIIVMLLAGTFSLEPMLNSDPAKLDVLQIHMSLGLGVLVLMLIRLIVRWRSAHPPLADAGHPLLNRAGVWAHWGLYLLVFAMIGSGIGTSLMAGLPDIVFGRSGAPLPPDLMVFAPRQAHGIIAKLLLLLVLAHVAAALYHQLIRRDGLLSRMWFGGR